MLKILTQKRFCLSRNVVSDSIKRFFLSNAYKCTDVWDNRLKYPVFEKLNLDNMYNELDLNLGSGRRVNIVDIDLFINGLTSKHYKQEIEDVLFRLRHCPECVLLPDRTNHAAIRFFFQHTTKEELLNVLSDRLNYGLFPDHYLNNLMMDKFLKDKDAMTAVKIAVLQMLQEDFDHPITKMLSLHSCYNYLSSSDVWKSYKEPEPDPDEEVIPVRVKYVKNAYFDDHFDITDTNHLVGKTLWLIGLSLSGTIGVSSQLIGLVLYEKFDKCAELLNKVLSNNTRIHEEAVNKAREYTLKKPKQVEEVESEKGEEKDSQSEGEKAVDENKTKVLELLEKLDKGNLVKGNLVEESAELLKKEVTENEKKDIEMQYQVYKQWEADRENDVKEEILKVEAKKAEMEINKIKQELQEEEEKLFFFDNEDNLLLQAKEKEKEMKNVKVYKGKYEKNFEEEYVPPVVAPQKSK